jgi:lysophospholipase L1-like esterase
VVNSDKSVIHVPTSFSSIKNVFNTQGQRMTMMPATASYSNNGKWLLFDSHGYGLVRMDMTDGSILAFGNPTRYNQGFDPGYQTAISADGRYAVVATIGRFDVYDLNTCVERTGVLSYLKSCNFRSLEAERVNKTNFGRGAGQVRFSNDRSLTYYTGELNGPSNTYRQYRITLGDIPEYTYGYLGLGDSFTSGEGAYNYKPFTDTTENMCHLSTLSYPYLIGRSANIEEYESVACSGAVIQDIYLIEKFKEEYEGQFPDGIKQAQRDIKAVIPTLQPGLITQETFVYELNPEVVTVSIGGNDMGFSEKIISCIANLIDDTCFDSYEDRVEIVLELKRLIPRLTETYAVLKENNRRVYAIGYPRLVQPGGDCALNVSLNNSETDFADKLVGALNQAVEVAARRAGVKYVDVSEILAGRKLCETKSDHTLVHGITEGDDVGFWEVKLLAKEGFHPKLGAHELYKEAVLNQTANLNVSMPQSDPGAILYIPANDPFWQVEPTNRPVWNPIYNDLLPPRISLGEVIDININGFEIGVAPNATVRTEAHSTPTFIKEFSADQKGNINQSIQLPDDIEPGFHSLHFLTTSITGQSIDVYDYVFVGASDKDFDGDGILDNDETGCVLIRASGLDDDQDGLDNSCDDIVDPIQTEEDPDLGTPVDEGSGSDNGEVTEELPEIEVPEEKVVGNNESVAGNEPKLEKQVESSTSDSADKRVATASNQAIAQSTTATAQPTTRNQESAQETPEVLSENTIKPDASEPVTVAPSSVNGKPSDAPVVKNTKVYWVVAIVSVLGFFGLVIWLLLARRS